MTSLKTSIKTITYLSDTGCLEIQGASLVRCPRIIVESPVLENTRYTSAMGGGKAIHFEGGIQEEIAIFDVIIKNCSLGISMQGAPDGSKASRAISITSPQMYNVDIPFIIYSQYSSPDTNNPRTMSM